MTRWDPFADFDWLGGLGAFRDLARPRLALLGPDSAREIARFAAPAVDVSEDEERYVVSAEIPGANKDDVTVEVHDGVLTLHGEKRNERQDNKEHRHLMERAYGSFSRSFRLPNNAETSQVRATFRDGVLTVEIPKTPEAKPRRVSIGE